MTRMHNAARAGLVIVLAAPVIAGTLDPPAGPVAQTMKTLQQVEPRIPLSAETTPGDADSVFRITSAGSYYLTQNLIAPLGIAAIEIAASDVTIDLGGFMINGTGLGTGITSPLGSDRITIRNGTIRDMAGNGISLNTSTDVRIESVLSYSNGSLGMYLGARSTVVDSIALANVSTGIYVGAESIVERSQSINNAGGPGFFVGSAGRVSACTARGNTTGIIVTVGSNGGLIQDCFVSANSTGISVSGTGWTVIRNVALDNTTTNYTILVGNNAGTIVVSPAGAGPMDNISN